MKYPMEFNKGSAMKKTYGIVIKRRETAQRPVAIAIGTSEGSRIVQSTARRVIQTHQRVIKALANR